jgi:thiamine kinase-like enzyme
MLDFKKYLDSHTLRKLTQGKSGAVVCLLDDGKIAKFVEKQKLLEKANGLAVWDSCLKEAKFYKEMMGAHYAFLPEIFHCDFDDEKVQIIMGEYKQVEKNNLSESDFDKIMKLLVQVHELPLPDFLRYEKRGPVEIPEDEIKNCLAGWKSIFDEHQTETSAILDFSKIQKLADSINQLNKESFSDRSCLCHGDFHAENILCDEKSGQLVLCDWQSVSLGHPVSDIAFFMSRLQGDGITFDENKIIESYCASSKSGITKDEIKKQMALANINTTFRYWHYYLHGSSKEVVEGIVGKMLIAQAELI